MAQLAVLEPPVRTELVEHRLPDGNIALREVPSPAWIAPRAAGQTPMGEALRRAGVALWDTIGAGRRTGSLDTKIRDIEPNPVAALVASHPTIRLIGCNGGKSFEQLRRNAPELFENPSLAIVRLPSTSPAAATMRYEQKREAWSVVAEFLRKNARRN